MIESDAQSWNSKVANAILAQVQGTSWANPERASSYHINSASVYARRRPRRGRVTTIALPGPFTETSLVESLVVYCIKTTVDIISEEVLGRTRELLEAARGSRCGESSSCPCQTCLGQRPRQIAATVERLRTKVIAGEAPLHSIQWQNQESYTQRQGDDVEIKDHRPFSCLGSREPMIL